ncbi:hypothetical protein [Actinoplanes sp. URMC 104]|uniref:hypothetical protein n=1 Tax=Actinoplanes sp. URMC 104 TaxID=3423409 RepID=UPI003F1B81FA
MHPELTAALAPVLRELEGPGGVRLKVVDEGWENPMPGDATAVVWDPAGMGMGIRVELGRPAGEQIAHVADQVQEWAVEALWRLERPTNWPPCPHHPSTHPLAARELDGWAYWVCPAGEDPIREIGSTGATGDA